MTHPTAEERDKLAHAQFQATPAAEILFFFYLGLFGRKSWILIEADLAH